MKCKTSIFAEIQRINEKSYIRTVAFTNFALEIPKIIKCEVQNANRIGLEKSSTFDNTDKKCRSFVLFHRSLTPFTSKSRERRQLQERVVGFQQSDNCRERDRRRNLLRKEKNAKQSHVSLTLSLNTLLFSLSSLVLYRALYVCAEKAPSALYRLCVLFTAICGST